MNDKSGRATRRRIGDSDYEVSVSGKRQIVTIERSFERNEIVITIGSEASEDLPRYMSQIPGGHFINNTSFYQSIEQGCTITLERLRDGAEGPYVFQLRIESTQASSSIKVRFVDDANDDSQDRWTIEGRDTRLFDPSFVGINAAPVELAETKRPVMIATLIVLVVVILLWARC